LGSLKDFFLKFLLYAYRENQWPPGAGPILTPGLLFEQSS
jgi:hypothetical protein